MACIAQKLSTSSLVAKQQCATRLPVRPSSIQARAASSSSSGAHGLHTVGPVEPHRHLVVAEAAATASGALQLEQSQPQWLEALLGVFKGQAAQSQDEEWLSILPPGVNKEELWHEGGHSMYTSHLAERMAVEPRGPR